MPASALVALALAAAVADSTRYVVLNHGRPAGEMTVVRRADTVRVRYQHVDRNRGTNVAANYRITPTGQIVGGEAYAWPFGGPLGDAVDRFEVERDSATWGVVPASRGGARLAPGTYVRLRGAGTALDQALLARFLLRRPDRSGRLLPLDTPARVEVVADTALRIAGRRTRLRFAVVTTGRSATGGGVWLDDRDELVAGEVGWFIPVREGAEPILPVLRTLELRYRDARGAALARGLARPNDRPILIRDGDVFDSERGTILPRTAVLIRDGKIAAVGPDAAAQAPADAEVIDATGRTVLPGLWDMHGHLQHTSQTSGAVLQLAAGITTVRDLASDVDVAVSYRDRAARGELLGPRAILAGFLEGPGAWAGPSEALVHTEAEARRWVARYDSLGYRQVKLYNLTHPDLVPAIVAEAHRRGMRVSGHVPRGLTVPAAIALGFDEINHSAFLFSTFFQDSLYVPRMRAYSAVAIAVAPNVNVDGPEFTALIDAMRRAGTVLDGTFNLWVPPDSSRANASWLRLAARLDSAGVTLVPGTDNSAGTTYVTELETYARAGIPPAKVLQMATIVSARVMKEDAHYGSLTPGKVADVVIVDGRPHERLTELRRVERVIRGGRAYTSTELREAIGFRVAQTARRER